MGYSLGIEKISEICEICVNCIQELEILFSNTRLVEDPRVLAVISRISRIDLWPAKGAPSIENYFEHELNG